MGNLIDNMEETAFASSISSVILAAVIIFITALVSYLITKLIRKIMSVDGSQVPECSLIVNIGRLVVWIAGLSIMLSTCFGVDVDALLAALGIGGLALSLGLQGTIKNFIGGLQITIMGILRPGDHVVIGDIEGIVQDVTWRQAVVKDYENVVHIIPNSMINSSTVSKVEPRKLVSTIVVLNTDGRDIDEVLNEMESLAKCAVEAVAPLEKDPWLLVTQIGEYGIWAKMRFVLADTTHAREARDAALRAIAPYTRNDADTILIDGEVAEF